MTPFGKYILTALSLLSVSAWLMARQIDIHLVPGNWWVGMKTDTITLLAQGNFTGPVKAAINHSSVRLVDQFPAEHPQYHFVQIVIPKDASPNVIPITFSDSGGNKGVFYFSLDQKSDYRQQGPGPGDIIYQIVPDRFCNGNKENDQIKGYYELSDRLNPFGIHGGDLQGLTSRIDYLQTMGVTCIDILPVYESNLMSLSYQRDGVTDFYTTDKRLGSNSDYIRLIDECHSKAIKVAQTMVFNQLGLQHPWFKSPPLTEFFSQSSYEYHENTIIAGDPYASIADKESVYSQWPELNMPVWNQNSRIVQDLLIQHCLWWIETARIDMVKIDHIEQNRPAFLDRLLRALNLNFPGIHILSDCSSRAINEYFWQDLAIEAGMPKQQIHIIDYKLYTALSDAFSSFKSINEGLENIYDCLSRDRQYLNASGNIIMADNHQTSRLFSNADKETEQARMMMGFILTTRGIPSLFYGTECLLDGTIDNGNGFVRKDFPGAWPEDSKNAFINKGLTHQEMEFNQWMRRIMKWRSENSSIFSGHLTHFAPREGIYAYYHIHNKQGAFVLINNSDKPVHINPQYYEEAFGDFATCYDVIKDKHHNDFSNLIAEKKSIVILQLSP